MDDFAGGKALVYKSDNIFERRRRVLREARRMISEAGLEGFSVRELCARAGIAQKTLYNAFGGKDNVIALAIRQYMADFIERTSYHHEGMTLEGRLERLVKVHSRNIQVGPYTRAIMSVYNSPADRTIRQVIRDMSEAGLRPYVESLAAAGALGPGVSPPALVALLSTVVYAILSDWCLGEVRDEDLVNLICEAFLVVICGHTVGEAEAEARRWLTLARARAPEWLALRRISEVAPAEIAAARRRAEPSPAGGRKRAAAK